MVNNRGGDATSPATRKEAMYTILVQFGGLDGLMQVFKGRELNVLKSQIRSVAAGLGTPESDIHILCSKEIKP